MYNNFSPAPIHSSRASTRLPIPALGGLTDLTGFTWPKGNSATSPQTCSPQGSAVSVHTLLSVAQAKISVLPSSPSFSHASFRTPHTQSLTDQADFTSKIHPEFDIFSPPSLGTAWSTPPSWLTGRIAVIHSGYILCSGHTGQTVTRSPCSPAVKWENRGNVL